MRIRNSLYYPKYTTFYVNKREFNDFSSIFTSEECPDIVISAKSSTFNKDQKYHLSIKNKLSNTAGREGFYIVNGVSEDTKMLGELKFTFKEII